MRQAFTSQNLQALFTFPFRDPDWKQKVLIGSLVVFLGFIIPIVPSLLL